MGLTSYAELAVRLVNSASNGGHQDMLSEPEAVRALLADRSDLRGPVTRVDLDALRHLRDELTAVFSACTQGDPAAGVERLNALLISHPVHPVIVPTQGGTAGSAGRTSCRCPAAARCPTGSLPAR